MYNEYVQPVLGYLIPTFIHALLLLQFNYIYFLMLLN